MGDENKSSGKGFGLDNIIDSSMALLVGVVILVSAVLPVVISQINSLPEIGGITEAQIAQFSGLLTAAVILGIVGLIIGIVRMYSVKHSDR